VTQNSSLYSLNLATKKPAIMMKAGFLIHINAVVFSTTTI
jgi:hypothetical protein